MRTNEILEQVLARWACLSNTTNMPEQKTRISFTTRNTNSRLILEIISQTVQWYGGRYIIFAHKNTDFRKHKKEAVETLKENGFAITDIRTLYEKETKTIHVVIYCHMEEREEE